MSPSLEALLGHADWVRSLARRLVAEADLADDLAQDVWVRALEREPGPEERPRSWLAGVLRNVERERRRARGRRFAREERAARPERVPSTADAIERVATQRDVVEAVLALDEPYRSTIVLRFFEDLPPRRIARREGVPVSTVKTRLARGLARLRERLDREHGGDGRTWAVALLPLAAPPSGGFVPPVVETLLVNTPTKVALVSAAAVSAVVWLQIQGGTPAEPSPAAASAASPAELVAPEKPSAPGPGEEPAALSPREAVAAAPPAAVEEPPSPADLLLGRVVDLSNHPVSGVALGGRMSTGVVRDEDGGSALWGEELATDVEPLAISGPDGRFEVSVGRFGGRLVSIDDAYETVLSPTLGTSSHGEVTVVVARRFELSGTVVDDAGRPIDGAGLAFLMPSDYRARLEVAHETILTGWRGTTAADGTFELDRLPAVEGARLRVRHPGFRVMDVERDRWSDEVLRLVLELPGEERIEGVVLAPGGETVAGAYVSLGSRAVETDADGVFRLGLEGLAEATTLRALAAGFLPAVLEGLPSEDGPVTWPDFVTLRLDGHPEAIAGRVVDAAGAPVGDQEVWLKNPETSHEDGWLPVVTESILAGDPGPVCRVTTDALGRFRFEGLMPRAYGLRAVDPRDRAGGRRRSGRGRPDRRRDRPPPDPYWPEVTGRVVTTGRRAAARRVPCGPPRRARRAPVRRVRHGVLGQRREGQDGRGGALRPRARAPGRGRDQRVRPTHPPLRTRAGSRCGRLGPRARRAEEGPSPGSPPGGGSRADALALIGADGEAQTLSVDTDDGSLNSPRVTIENGRSPVVGAGEDAVFLVLYAEGEEIERVPVRLATDELNVIDL